MAGEGHRKESSVERVLLQIVKKSQKLFSARSKEKKRRSGRGLPASKNWGKVILKARQVTWFLKKKGERKPAAVCRGGGG